MAQRKRVQKAKAVTETKAIRCVLAGRLIVPASRTPSGTQYQFERGQVQQVPIADYDYLLSMKRENQACCGGKSSSSYFQEVSEL